MSTVDEVDATNAQIQPSPSATPMTGSYPQTVKFDVAATGGGQPCGRVVFSSYHTLDSTTTSADPSVKLTPQERILEYLMLEAGACLGPVS
jgi:hypothetical protein